VGQEGALAGRCFHRTRTPFACHTAESTAMDACARPVGTWRGYLSPSLAAARWRALAATACCVLMAAIAPGARSATDRCQGLFDQYLDKHHKEASPYNGDNLLYFLHVPRTAGRTFHSCLLKMGTPPGRRCPKAYDHLRINMSVPNCYLLSSHDDFSVVSMLPDNVAVLSQVRDPVDRFLSAYEFAIEVASRTLGRAKKQRKKPGRIATEDVWPWSYLIPFFADDLAPKVSTVAACCACCLLPAHVPCAPC
jgi:hypothetical protein